MKTYYDFTWRQREQQKFEKKIYSVILPIIFVAIVILLGRAIDSL